MRLVEEGFAGEPRFDVPVIRVSQGLDVSVLSAHLLHTLYTGNPAAHFCFSLLFPPFSGIFNLYF